ncbi:hypothetical protein KO561_11160 [Radiobacillus kanasensis]|uniref:hypothetical protein n=1 Tax=Radiobacillus kanasensis TaxID=2844358 RepID=UPI001E622722|nr:hypothetical protein [Radiobacillus kanasensis]UFT97780.1 hypothetical protein KO561_11160 [Radiobacillus kanasensis]
MKSIIWITSVLFGATVVFQKRYKILNAILAVNLLRRFFVRLSMNVPSLRTKILPSLFGRSAS